MTIIPATPAHAADIAQLIMTAMTEECCQYLAGKEHTLDDFYHMMLDLVLMDDSQYSWRNAFVAVDEEATEARDKGDLSENAEYDAAKEAQAHLEEKINRLKVAISEAKIIDTSRLSTDCVQILSKVEMVNLANNAKMAYTIVSESEANLREGKISVTTPIAQGLLNKKVGDEVEIKIPRGTIRLRIENITFA